MFSARRLIIPGNIKKWSSLSTVKHVWTSGSYNQEQQTSETSQKKIYELRIYTIKPHRLREFLELTKEEFHLRTAHSKLFGYWMSEIGGLNQVVHIWEYAMAVLPAARTLLFGRLRCRLRLLPNDDWLTYFNVSLLHLTVFFVYLCSLSLITCILWLSFSITMAVLPAARTLLFGRLRCRLRLLPNDDWLSRQILRRDNSLTHRANVRANLAGDSVWISRYLGRVVEMFQEMNNSALILLPGTKIDMPTSKGVYELQTLRLTGSPLAWSKTLVEYVKTCKEIELNSTKLVGAWQSVLGPKQMAAFLWYHPGPDSSISLQQATDSLHANVALSTHVNESHSRLLLPHPVSPLQ